VVREVQAVAGGGDQRGFGGGRLRRGGHEDGPFRMVRGPGEGLQHRKTSRREVKTQCGRVERTSSSDAGPQHVWLYVICCRRRRCCAPVHGVCRGLQYGARRSRFIAPRWQ
jgi:hypothetical protein